MSTQDSGRQSDAVTLLRTGHRNFENQLAFYRALPLPEHQKKKQMIEQMSVDLIKHLEMEEKIFYPEVKAHIKGLVSIMNQGIVEHIRLRFLIKQLSAMNGSDLLFDEHVQQLVNSIERHISRAESYLLPKVNESKINLHDLGLEMQVHERTQGSV